MFESQGGYVLSLDLFASRITQKVMIFWSFGIFLKKQTKQKNLTYVYPRIIRTLTVLTSSVSSQFRVEICSRKWDLIPKLSSSMFRLQTKGLHESRSPKSSAVYIWEHGVGGRQHVCAVHSIKERNQGTRKNKNTIKKNKNIIIYNIV